MPYEVIEHTADIGLKIWGKDLPSLFRDAAEGFFDLVTDFSLLQHSPPVFYHAVEEVRGRHDEEFRPFQIL